MMAWQTLSSVTVPRGGVAELTAPISPATFLDLVPLPSVTMTTGMVLLSLATFVSPSVILGKVTRRE